MDDQEFGAFLRAVRRHHGWRQVDVAARAGVSQRSVSEIELGRLDHVGLAMIRRVATALDVRLRFDAWWRSGSPAALADQTHAALVEHTLRLFQDHGWETRVEISFNHFGERGAADLVAWHAPSSTLAIGEAKSRIDDVQETNATFLRKARILPGLLAADEGWHATSVGRVLVVADTTTTRTRIAQHRATFASTWPGTTPDVRSFIADPSARPNGGGILFVTPARAVATTRAA